MTGFRVAVADRGIRSSRSFEDGESEIHHGSHDGSRNVHVQLAAVAGDRSVHRFDDRDGPRRECAGTESGRADADRDRDAVLGVGGSPGDLRRLRPGRSAGGPRLRASGDPLCGRRAGLRASRRGLSADRRGRRRPRPVRTEFPSRSGRSPSRSTRSRRSREPTTWAWRSPATRWALTGSGGSRASGPRWRRSSAGVIWASSRSPAIWRGTAG